MAEVNKPTDPLQEAINLLREEAARLLQIYGDHHWYGFYDEKAAYQKHLAAAEALESFGSMTAPANMAMLHAHAYGHIGHINKGLCPNGFEDHGSRDPDCPLCRTMDSASVVGPSRMNLGDLVNSAGIYADDKPATVVRKLDAAFLDAQACREAPTPSAAPAIMPKGESAAAQLRAMATNYPAGHSWDKLDAKACIRGALEIEALRTLLAQATAAPAAAPVVLPEPDSVVAQMMELVKDWAQRNLIAAEAGIDTLTEESSEKERQEAARLDGEAQAAYRAIETKLRALLAQATAAPADVAGGVKYVPVDCRLRDSNWQHPKDDEPRTEACQAALQERGDDVGQGLDGYWKWGFAAGFNAALATTRAAPAAVAGPTSWRELAARVMDALAEAQERTNEKYPEHVKCYPSWVSGARWLRWHAEMFRTGKPIGNGAGQPSVIAALNTTAAQGDALEWLQPQDKASLERFAETTEDDESYDIGKAAVARLAGFGCLQSHGFGKYSITDFGHYVLNDWTHARALPFTTQAERDAAHREAIAARAAGKGVA
jgi:hypothetical protein